MVIYETDTNNALVWDGTSWVSLNPVDRDRNVVINGAMQIAQRGTSVTGITGTGYYTADRWQFGVGTMGTWTQTVENDAPTGSGFRKSLKVLCTTADASPAAGDSLAVVHAFEGQNLQQFLKGTTSAKPFTVSFWVKANVTGTYIVELVDADNTRRVSASYSVSASATWEKKTITFPADTTGAFDNDNALSLNLRFWLGTGTDFSSGSPLQTTWGTGTTTRATGQTNLASATNNYWQVTGVQLEAGAVATPFEFEDYSTTLRKCQRYFQTIDNNGNGRVLSAYMFSGTLALGTFCFPVTMRVAPTAISAAGAAGDYNVWYSNTRSSCSAVPSFNSSTPSTLTFLFTVSSGLTTGQGGAVGYETATGRLSWSTEL
jgi:hypothetical protein